MIAATTFPIISDRAAKCALTWSTMQIDIFQFDNSIRAIATTLSYYRLPSTMILLVVRCLLAFGLTLFVHIIRCLFIFGR